MACPSSSRRGLGRSDSKALALAACLALSLTAQSAMAAGGAMWGEKDVRVVSTKWFDIIYPERSAEAAAVLAGRADKIYEEVCADFRVEPRERFPVTLAPSRETFNAFYTQFLYNHIVVYDTPAPRDMDTSSENFLNAFRHETAHAVTYNMKNKFWRGATEIFGDPFALGAALLTPSHAEGAAVVEESMGGEGRLNDPCSFLAVRQAKIEGRFPSYADVYGARDRYPSDLNYSFGAAFDDWTRREYGMEKYARFWYKCVNFLTIHQSFAFKKIYGVSMKDAWKKFKDSIPVPDTPGDPLSTGCCADFFSLAKGNCGGERSMKNKSGARYGFVSSDGNGNVTFCDKKTGGIFIARRAEDGSVERPRKILTVANGSVSSARLSADGRFVAVSVSCSAHAAEKTEVRVFDTKTRRMSKVGATGMRDAAVIRSGGGISVAAVRTLSRRSWLSVWRAETRQGGATRFALAAELPVPDGEAVYDLADAGNGEIAALRKRGGEWHVALFDAETLAEKEIALPKERMAAREISLAGSADDGTRTFFFSWTAPGTLARLGTLAVDADGEAEFSLQSRDISGGVSCPAHLKNWRGESRAVYAGNFFEDSRMLVMDASKIPAEKFAARVSESPRQERGGRTDMTVLEGSKKLGALKYFARGAWFPIGSASLYDRDAEADEWLALGATLVTALPWFGGSGAAALTGGWRNGAGVLQATVAGGTDTQAFKFKLTSQLALNTCSFRQTAHFLDLSSTIPAGNVSSLSFSNETRLVYDKDEEDEIESGSSAIRRLRGVHTDWLYVKNTTSAIWSCIHKTGDGTFERGGLSAQIFCRVEYARKTWHLEPGDESAGASFQNLGARIKAAIPRLLPFPCASGLTCNLPAQIALSLYPTSSVFARHSETVTIFAAEIQRAIPAASLIYANRVAIEATYTGEFRYADGPRTRAFLDSADLFADFFNGRMALRDSLELYVSLTLTPNYGALVRFHVALKGGVEFKFNRDESENFARAKFSAALNF